MEMLTRDHVKAYKDKIKGALVEYMAMPASERSSGAIRARPGQRRKSMCAVTPYPAAVARA